MKQLVLFSILFLSSCSFIIKKIGGIKDPKLETYQSINKYSKSLEIDSSLIVFAKDSTSFFVLNKLFVSCPEILIFNNSKQYIPYKNDSTTCNASIDYTLENICTISQNNFHTSRIMNYENLTSCFVDPNNALTKLNLDDYDYIVFINYSKFTHGINRTHIIPWNKIIRETKNNCRVKYIYVNLDYLNTWGIQKSSLPKIKIKAT